MSERKTPPARRPTVATKKLDAPEWFFMWTGPSGYVTSICGWNKASVMAKAERTDGGKWRNIYRRGGRVVRFTLTKNRIQKARKK